MLKLYSFKMKKIIQKILIPFLLISCTTVNDLNNNIDNLSLFSLAETTNIIDDTTDLEQFRSYGKSISNIPIRMLAPHIESDKSMALEYLEKEMLIPSKKELLRVIDFYYFEGYTADMIEALELLTTKPELLNDPAILVKEETWSSELSSGMIKKNILRTIKFLVENPKITNLKDVRIYDLVTISLLVRLGVASELITQNEANNVYDQISLELLKFNGTWYDFSKSYLSGVAYFHREMDDLNSSVFANAFAALEIIKFGSYSNDDLSTIKKYSNLTAIKTLYEKKTNNYILPKLPPNITTTKNIELLYNYDRLTYDLINFHYIDYMLNLAVLNNNYKEVLSYLNSGDTYYDYLNHVGNSLIHEAIGKDIRILESLLSFGFNPNMPSKSTGDTALHKAVTKQEYNDIRALLENKADPNILNIKDETPLCFAVDNNDIRALSLLLEFSADPELGYVGSYKPFGYSLRNSYDLISRELIKYIDNMNALAIDDWTYTHIATRYANLDILEQILLKGGDLNLLRDNGWSAVQLVHYNEDDDVNNRYNLVEKMGGNFNYVKSNGYNILTEYLNSEHFKIYDENKDNNEFIDVANFAPYFRYLLDRTENLYQTESDNRSILWFMRNYGSKEDIDYLLEKTSEQKIDSVNGYIILRSFLNRDLKDEFEIVLKRITDLNYRNENGWNIFYLAYSNPKFYWAGDILLENGFDLNFPGSNDEKVIDMLGRKGEYNLYLKLLDYGAVPEKIYETVKLARIENSEESKNFINSLIKLNLASELDNQYFGDNQSFWDLSNYFENEIIFDSNKLTFSNNNESSLRLASSDKLLIDDNFTVRFLLPDYDKGVMLYLPCKYDNSNVLFY